MHRPEVQVATEHDDQVRRIRNLAGIAIVLVIVVASLVVIRKIQVREMLADCAAAQRPACETTVDRLRVSRLVDRLLSR